MSATVDRLNAGGFCLNAAFGYGARVLIGSCGCGQDGHGLPPICGECGEESEGPLRAGLCYWCRD